MFISKSKEDLETPQKDKLDLGKLNLKVFSDQNELRP